MRRARAPRIFTRLPNRCLFSSTGSLLRDVDLSYPAHPKPTAHEIFHLPLNASPVEIKERYYQLVRLHHPDSPHCRHEPDEVRHERFKSIAKAYETLRRDKIPLHVEEVRHRGRGLDAYGFGPRRQSWGYDPPGGRWDQVSVGNGGVFGIVSILAIVGSLALLYSPVSPSSISNQRHLAAQQALSEARREGKQNGAQRRAQIRKWVEDAGLEGAGSEIGRGGRAST